MRIFALLLLTACASAPWYGSPDKLSVCSHPNVLPYRVGAMLRDDAGHTQYIGNVDPGDHICATWNLDGEKGQWGFFHDAEPIQWELGWFYPKYLLKGSK